MMVHYNESMDRAMLPLNNMIICGQMCSLKFVGASLSLLPPLGNSAEDAEGVPQGDRKQGSYKVGPDGTALNSVVNNH